MSQTKTPIRLRLNGADYDSDTGNLAELLIRQGLKLEQKGIAVAQNGKIVAKTRWSETLIRSGDELEILVAIQGG
ncbi:MAG: sulfur carrier protein ThiS [Candidatus Pacebacteria bacterium]|nr:sulfur carrier protein ThiS [Candidatus Paceibacterota bacterium]